MTIERNIDCYRNYIVSRTLLQLIDEEYDEEDEYEYTEGGDWVCYDQL